MMTLNNESLELNLYRIEHFGLRDIFEAFFSSCWLGSTKPSHEPYQLALGISQARPDCAVFIDDREPNLVPARALGMRTIHFTPRWTGSPGSWRRWAWSPEDGILER